MIVSDCRSYSRRVQITWLWVIVGHILSRWLWVIVAQEKCDCRHLCWGTISRTSISYIIAFTWYFMIVTKDLFVRDQKRVSSMTIKLIFNRSSHERYWPLQKNMVSELYSGKWIPPPKKKGIRMHPIFMWRILKVLAPFYLVFLPKKGFLEYFHHHKWEANSTFL